MNRFVAPMMLLTAIAGSEAFAPMNSAPLRRTKLQVSSVGDLPYFLSEVDGANASATESSFFAMKEESENRGPIAEAPTTSRKAPVTKNDKKNAAGGAHKEGLLSPFVTLAKEVLGEDELNKLRGKVIGIHSDVIGKFVDTHETPFGQQILKALFAIADKNSNGTIEEEELAQALKTLGFDLKEKQIKGVFERADADANGAIDLEEWMSAAPKTLRTNLIKLAKKNGGDMGLLA